MPLILINFLDLIQKKTNNYSMRTQNRHVAVAQKYAIIKNPQFLPDFFETWSKCPPYESVILTKSQRNWVKIADFLIKAYF